MLTRTAAQDFEMWCWLQGHYKDPLTKRICRRFALAALLEAFGVPI